MESERTASREMLPRDVLLRALSENYESIYVIQSETSVYQCFHESDSYSSLQLETRGDNFFYEVEHNILKTIYPEDQAFVRKKLSREALLTGLERKKFYSFVYRLMIEEKPLYHKLRATTAQIGGKPHILIGIRNVDAAFRQDKNQAEELSAMRSKEKNHLEAILASADSYLEVNLSKDTIHEVSPLIFDKAVARNYHFATESGMTSYSEFMRWRAKHVIVENKESFIRVSNRDYLIRCFENGEKRASVSFSVRNPDGQVQPYRKVFYLYRDALSGDILTFCVLYNLTEQQRREKELKELEYELQMSRLRNFTSQMQPHFLYNTLGSIQEIMLDDPVYASELIGDFTVHLRSCIRAMSNDAPIPFDQELANIKAYVNIEKMRFGDKLKVLLDIQADDFSILPLSIQPIVENAIRHGIYERGEQGGTVTVRTERVPGSVIIMVEDTGVGFNVEALEYAMAAGQKDSAGLKNIMFRLDKMMHAAVEIRSTPRDGTAVVITIPEENARL